MELLYEVSSLLRGPYNSVLMRLAGRPCRQLYRVYSNVKAYPNARDECLPVGRVVARQILVRSSLRKEGVLHEVSTISKIELKIKVKPVPPPGAPSGDNADNANPSEEGSAPSPVLALFIRQRCVTAS
jgi:hypothetical protein